MTTFNYRDDNEPPDELDGAEVILWAFHPQKPFFIMEYSDGTQYKPIHGFAICRYKGEQRYYKFSCDINWNVENDLDCGCIEEAVKIATDMSNEPIIWNKKQSSINN